MSASKEKKIRKEQRGAADRDFKAIQAEKDQQTHSICLFHGPFLLLLFYGYIFILYRKYWIR